MPVWLSTLLGFLLPELASVIKGVLPSLEGDVVSWLVQEVPAFAEFFAALGIPVPSAAAPVSATPVAPAPVK